MSCQPAKQETGRRSTLPPLCPPCHRKPPRFVCPKYGCPPIQECPFRRCCCPPPPRPVLVCKPRPKPPPRPPTLCLPAPCPQLPGPVPHPCSRDIKIQPPPSCVRYCLSTTCGQTTYAPCYFSNLPQCPRDGC